MSISRSRNPEKFSYCREPFRLFFPLAVLMGIAGVGHWILYATGLTPDYSGFLHSSIQSRLYLGLFVAGFLMTAVPRFSGTFPATRNEGGIVIFLSVASVLFLEWRQWTASEICSVLFLAEILFFLIRRFRRKNTYTPPAEFVWIPAGIFAGILGNSLMIGFREGFLPPAAGAVGKPLSEQGFILSIVLGVGGFLGPRLLGFSSVLNPAELRVSAKKKMILKRVFLHLSAICILWVSFWQEACGQIGSAYALRAAVITAELFWTTLLYRKPESPVLFARLFWVSLWMVVAGYWLCAFFPLHRVALLHLVFIGGYSLMTFAVGTMVVLSHTGQGELLKTKLPVLQAVGIAVFVAIALRLLATQFPSGYFQWLGLASAFWVAGSAAWLWFAVSKLLSERTTAGWSDEVR